MRFWDSSAIVPLVCRERESSRCRAWLREDPVVVVWALAATEVASAIARKQRQGMLSERTVATAHRRLSLLEEAWSEVHELDAARARARRLLRIHPLSAAEAMHLAAALLVTEERTRGVGFVTFDERLAEAAEREGFQAFSG